MNDTDLILQLINVIEQGDKIYKGTFNKDLMFLNMILAKRQFVLVVNFLNKNR